MGKKTRKKFIINYKNLIIFLLGFNFLCSFLNPDMFFGIADSYYIIFLIIVLFAIKTLFRKSKLINSFNFPVLGLIIYILYAAFASFIYRPPSSGYTLSYLIYLILLFVLLTIDFTKYDLHKIVNYYILSAFIIAIIMFIQRYDYYGSGGQRFTIKILNHDAFDPNFLGAYLVVPCLLSFAKFLNKMSFLKSIIFIIIVSAILMTGSRGAMLSTAIGGFIMFLNFIRKNFNFKIIIMSLTFMILGFFILLNFVPINSLLRIFDLSSYNDGSNNKRLLDWIAGLQAFKGKPFFGYGVYDELSIIQNATGVNLISHNTYIALLLQFGIIGILFFAVGFLFIFKSSIKNLNLLAILLATGFYSVFISAQVTMFLWYPIIVVACIAKFEHRTKTNNLWL